MIYLDQFKLPSHETEDKLLKMQGYMSEAGYTDNPYPCHLFVQKQLSSLENDEIHALFAKICIRHSGQARFRSEIIEQGITEIKEYLNQ